MSRSFLVLSAFCGILYLGSYSDLLGEDNLPKEETIKSAALDSPKVDDDSSSRRILFFTAKWCCACQKLKKSEFPELIETNWKIGLRETDHIQIIDGDKHPELIEKYDIEYLPTLVLEVDGKVIDKRGYLDAHEIAEMYYGRLDSCK